MAGKGLPFRFHDHMTDVTGIPVGAGQQAAVQHDAPTDSRRNDHGEVVRTTDGRTHPTLGQGQGLRIILEANDQPGEFAEASRQGEVSPRRNVQWRDALAVTRHRPATPHPASLEPIEGPQTCHQISHRREQVLAVVRSSGRGRNLTAFDQPPAYVDNAGGDLGSSDVDSQDRALIVSVFQRLEEVI
jgi:hypothetical protein